MSVKEPTSSIATKWVSICQKEKKCLYNISSYNRVYSMIIVVNILSCKLLLQIFYVCSSGRPSNLSEIKILGLCRSFYYTTCRYNRRCSTDNSSRMIPMVMFTKCAGPICYPILCVYYRSFFHFQVVMFHMIFAS